MRCDWLWIGLFFRIREIEVEVLLCGFLLKTNSSVLLHGVARVATPRCRQLTDCEFALSFLSLHPFFLFCSKSQRARTHDCVDLKAFCCTILPLHRSLFTSNCDYTVQNHGPNHRETRSSSQEVGQVSPIARTWGESLSLWFFWLRRKKSQKWPAKLHAWMVLARRIQQWHYHSNENVGILVELSRTRFSSWTSNWGIAWSGLCRRYSCTQHWKSAFGIIHGIYVPLGKANTGPSEEVLHWY